MKKNLIALTVILLIFGVLTIGCSNNEQPTQGDVSKETEQPVDSGQDSSETDDSSLEDPNLELIVKAFKDAGMEVGDYQPIAYEIIGAKDGRKFELNGSLIEIYEYDPNNLTEEGKEIFESATENGTFDMSGFQVSCIMNGNYMLVRFDEHPEKDRIIDIFKNFK